MILQHQATLSYPAGMFWKGDASNIFRGTTNFVALAKTQNINLPVQINCVCEPDQEAFQNIQYPTRRQDSYWAVNTGYQFSKTYHSRWSCVNSGVRWGFPNSDGIYYYLPLSLERCANCMRVTVARLIPDAERDENRPRPTATVVRVISEYGDELLFT